MKVAESLKRFRKSARLTQDDVANVLKIKRPAYSRYETGQFVPRADVIVKLAQTYNVSSDYLLGLSDMPNPTLFDEKEVEAAFALRDAVRAATAGQIITQDQPVSEVKRGSI
ncbi:MAG: helix-turn-helix transcriptional regulator [Selenomonadaceae bacterium]|nr:helix-turn-helix transcriptional regulator [Selenomonadaceae bacterium]